VFDLDVEVGEIGCTAGWAVGGIGEAVLKLTVL